MSSCSSLCILDSQPCVVFFANIFFQFVTCLIIIFMVSFDEESYFNEAEYKTFPLQLSLFNDLFISSFLPWDHRDTLLYYLQRVFFLTLLITSKILINLELIFLFIWLDGNLGNIFPMDIQLFHSFCEKSMHLPLICHASSKVRRSPCISGSVSQILFHWCT